MNEKTLLILLGVGAVAFYLYKKKGSTVASSGNLTNPQNGASTPPATPTTSSIITTLENNFGNDLNEVSALVGSV